MVLWDCCHLKGKDYQSNFCTEVFYVNRQSTNSDNHHIFGTGKILSPIYGLSSRRDSPETSVTPPPPNLAFRTFPGLEVVSREVALGSESRCCVSTKPRVSGWLAHRAGRKAWADCLCHLKSHTFHRKHEREDFFLKLVCLCVCSGGRWGVNRIYTDGGEEN